MHDFGDRSSSPAASDSSSSRKRLGGYLVEAGLLTPAQIDVALNDQKLTGMRFGEILAARGWVKQQTIEYLMKKVILPEQEATRQQPGKLPVRQVGQAVHSTNGSATSIASRSGLAADISGTTDSQRHTPVRRDTPISKPLPSVGSSDDGVSWVG